MRERKLQVGPGKEQVEANGQNWEKFKAHREAAEAADKEAREIRASNKTTEEKRRLLAELRERHKKNVRAIRKA